MQYALCARTSLLRFHLFASIKARHRFRWIGSSIEFSSLKKTLESSLAVVRNKSILPLSLSLSKDTSIRFFFRSQVFESDTCPSFFSLPQIVLRIDVLFFALDEAAHHLKVDVHSPIPLQRYFVPFNLWKISSWIREKKLIHKGFEIVRTLSRLYLPQLSSSSKARIRLLTQSKRSLRAI